MATSLESNILEIGRLLHTRMMELKRRALLTSATLPPECLVASEQLVNIAHDIEDVKLELANRITAVVLQSQVARAEKERELGMW